PPPVLPPTPLAGCPPTPPPVLPPTAPAVCPPAPVVRPPAPDITPPAPALVPAAPPVPSVPGEAHALNATAQHKDAQDATVMTDELLATHVCCFPKAVSITARIFGNTAAADAALSRDVVVATRPDLGRWSSGRTGLAPAGIERQRWEGHRCIGISRKSEHECPAGRH